MRLVIRGAEECIEVTIDAGERALDALDEGDAPLPLFSCRSANCGICLVHVQSGAALLVPPTSHEEDTLRHLDAAVGARLLCQVRVSPDVVDPTSIVAFELPPRARG